MFDSCRRHGLNPCYNTAMDPEIEELKKLVMQNLQLTADTNRIVHSMRRTARFGAFLHLLYWLLIIGFAVASYVYIQPYMQRLFQIYQQVETIGGQNTQQSSELQSFLQNPQQFLQRYLPSSQNSPAAPVQ